MIYSDKITFSEEQGKRPKDDEIGIQSHMDSPDPQYYLEWSKTSHVDAKTWEDDITPRKHFPTPTPPFGGHSSGTPMTIGQDVEATQGSRYSSVFGKQEDL